MLQEVKTFDVLKARAAMLFEEQLQSVYRRRDRVFAWLMAAQWVAGVLIAWFYSPYTWAGRAYSTHTHVFAAVFVGAAISVPSILLTIFRPGWVITRNTIAIGQMLWSALLIHLTGGRIETHFHVFGSLAFLAFYRDWKLIIPATVVVAGDHLVRGLFWPESVYGISNPEWWRFLEHAFWVIFEDVVLVMGIRENLREMRTLATRQAAMEEMNATIEHKVVERTRELESSREQYRSLVETTQTVPWQWDPILKRFSYVGPQAGRLLGCGVDDWLKPDFWESRLHPEDRETVQQRWEANGTSGEEVEFEFRLRRNDGVWVWVRSIVSGEKSSDKRLQGLMFDITQRRQMEFELRQAQKLESVGRLAAGVAHEINTPIQFVSDSVHFVRDAIQDLFGVVDKLHAVELSVREGTPSTDAVTAAMAAEQAADLPYLAEHVPKALDRSLEGLNRVATIVRSMKEFSHPDRKEMAPADLNRAIESTLSIARNEYKYLAEVETDLGELPPVTCHGGDISQAILNIVVNAAHAIGDVVKSTDQRGKISIRTRREGKFAVIMITDTGGGIPESIRERVFDPFFTTKPVGKGTGQGLAIARSIVVEKHGGELLFESTVGKGTTFSIRLPIDGTKTRSEALTSRPA